MAVSLVCDASALALADPTPAQVKPFAMPLECIFCPNQKQVPLRPQIQSWAADLLESDVVDDVDVDGESDPTDEPLDEMTPTMSVVLGLGPDETAAPNDADQL